MDQKIYFPTSKEYGTFATRRYPRGAGPNGGAGEVAVPTGGIPAELNPVPISLSFVSGLTGAHAETDRFSYTVPLRRRLKIQTSVARVRSNGAGAAGEKSAHIVCIRKGTVLPIMFAVAVFGSTVANQQVQDNNNGEQEFYEGDQIIFRTYDTSASAAVFIYDAFVLGIEYDAFQQAGIQAGQFDTGGESGGFLANRVLNAIDWNKF